MVEEANAVLEIQPLDLPEAALGPESARQPLSNPPETPDLLPGSSDRSPAGVVDVDLLPLERHPLHLGTIGGVLPENRR